MKNKIYIEFREKKKNKKRDDNDLFPYVNM